MKKCTTFVLGACLGAGTMLLFAPRPGAETRQRAWEKIDSALDGLNSEIVPPEDVDEPQGETPDFEETEPEKEPEEVEVSEAHEIPHQSEAAAKADELLDRIDAVRKRIVTQTLQNVSESLDAVSAAMGEAAKKAESQE